MFADRFGERQCEGGAERGFALTPPFRGRGAELRLHTLSPPSPIWGVGRFGQERTLALGLEVAVARSRRARLLGLAGLRREAAPPGLLIPNCRSVHTFGMRFALDLYFLDAEGRVLDARLDLEPGRFAGCRGAASVLEIPAEAFTDASDVGRSVVR